MRIVSRCCYLLPSCGPSTFFIGNRPSLWLGSTARTLHSRPPHPPRRPRQRIPPPVHAPRPRAARRDLTLPPRPKLFEQYDWALGQESHILEDGVDLFTKRIRLSILYGDFAIVSGRAAMLVAWKRLLWDRLRLEDKDLKGALVLAAEVGAFVRWLLGFRFRVAACVIFTPHKCAALNTRLLRIMTTVVVCLPA